MSRRWCALLACVMLEICGAATTDGTLQICAVLEMTETVAQDGSGVGAGEPCGSVVANVNAFVGAVNALNGGGGFSVSGGGAQHHFRLNFTHRTFASGAWATEGRNLSRALFPSCHYVVNMGSGCPSGDSFFIEQAAIAREAGTIAVTNRGPPELLELAANDHLFSIHVSSDKYPEYAVTQYRFRGVERIAIIGEEYDNFFFRGVTREAVRQVNSSALLTLATYATFQSETDASAMRAVRKGVRAAIEARAEVLMFSGRAPVWSELLNITYALRHEHTFQSIWSVVVPWAESTCAGQGVHCAWAIGATQMIDANYEQDFFDELLGISASDAGLKYVASRTDIRSGISAWLQAIKTVYEFRTISDPGTFLSARNDSERVREYMRSGAILGETHYGSVRFNSLGQNVGRDPTSVQMPLTSRAKVVYPIEDAEMSLVVPSPATDACGRNEYALRDSQNCTLCVATCAHCPENSNDLCECLPGYSAVKTTSLELTFPDCVKCPYGARCKNDTLSVKNGFWRTEDEDDKFTIWECEKYGVQSDACRGGLVGGDASCKAHHIGVMCSRCEDGFYREGSECKECDAQFLAFQAGYIVAALLFAYPVYKFLVSKSWIRSFQELSFELGISDVSKLKAWFAATQIISTVGWITGIAFPEPYRSWASVFVVWITYLTSFGSLGCLSSWDYDFHVHLVMSCLVPLLAAAVLAGVPHYIRYRRRARRARQHRRCCAPRSWWQYSEDHRELRRRRALAAARIQALCRGYVGRDHSRRRKQITFAVRERHRQQDGTDKFSAASLSYSFLVVFFFMPTTVTVILQTFPCVSELHVLRADLSIDCRSRTHNLMRYFAGLMLLVWVGILLLLIYHLRKFKKFIKPAKPNEDRTWKRGCNRLLRKIPGIQRRHKETDEGQHFHRCAKLLTRPAPALTNQPRALLQDEDRRSRVGARRVHQTRSRTEAAEYRVSLLFVPA